MAGYRVGTSLHEGPAGQ